MDTVTASRAQGFDDGYVCGFWPTQLLPQYHFAAAAGEAPTSSDATTATIASGTPTDLTGADIAPTHLDELENVTPEMLAGRAVERYL